jgi:hypothetical protein
MAGPLDDRAVGHGLMTGLLLGATVLLGGILALTVLAA